MKYRKPISLILSALILFSGTAASAMESEVTVPLGYYVVLSDGAYSVNDSYYNKNSEDKYQEDLESMTNEVSSRYSSADDPFMDYIFSDITGGIGLGDYDALADMLPSSAGEYIYSTVMTEEDFLNWIGQMDSGIRSQYDAAKEKAENDAKEGNKDAAEEIKDWAEKIMNGIDPETGLPYAGYIDENTPAYDPSSLISQNLAAIEQALADAMEGIEVPLGDASDYEKAMADFMQAYNDAYNAYLGMLADAEENGAAVDVYLSFGSLSDEEKAGMSMLIDTSYVLIDGENNRTLPAESFYDSDLVSFSTYINYNGVSVTINGKTENVRANSPSESGYIIDTTMNTLNEELLTYAQKTAQSTKASCETFYGFDAAGNARYGSMEGTFVTCEGCGQRLTVFNMDDFYLSNQNTYYCSSCGNAKMANESDCYMGVSNQYNADGTVNENYNADQWGDRTDTYLVPFINISVAGPSAGMWDFYQPLLQYYSMGELNSLFPGDGTVPSAEDAWALLEAGLTGGSDYNEDLNKIWGDISGLLSPYGLEGFDDPGTWSDADKARLIQGLEDFMETGSLSSDLFDLLGEKTTLGVTNSDPSSQAGDANDSNQAEMEKTIRESDDFNDAANKIFGDWPEDRGLWSDEMTQIYNDWMAKYNENGGENDFRRTLDEMYNDGYLDGESEQELLDGIMGYLNSLNDYTSMNDTVTVTTLLNVSDDLNVMESGFYFKDASIKVRVTDKKTGSQVFSTEKGPAETIMWSASAVGTYKSKRTLVSCPINYSIGTYDTTVSCYVMVGDEKVDLISDKTITRVKTDEQSISESIDAGNAVEYALDSMTIHVEELRLDIEKEDFYDTERVY